MAICLAHQDREAVAHCGVCTKPVCGECVIVSPQGKFCSEKCQKGAEAYQVRAADLKSREKVESPWGKILRVVILLAIIAAVLYVAFPYLPPAIKTPLMKFIHQVMPAVKR